MSKKILVTQSSLPDYEEYCNEIKELWDSHWLTNMGTKHRQFEGQLEQFLEAKHVSLFVNGHLALENALAAMGFPEGGEVITSPFTFASTTHAIVRQGLKPVFCDIDPTYYTLDAGKIEALITDKTCAIVPVHVYGNVCEVERIEQIAKKHGLKVIYDAAHAFGVTWRGQSVARFGDAAMFSFHATKVFHTIEGGAVCFSDDNLVQVLKDLKNFGIRDAETVKYVGGNAKMNEFQAAMGICNLRHFEEETKKRKAVVERYRERLAGVDGLVLCPDQPGVKPNYAYFPVVFEPSAFGATRDEVFEALALHEIGARKYFYPLTTAYDCFHGIYDMEQTPIALAVSRKILTLPLYADLGVVEVDRICDIVLDCKK